VKRQDEFVSTKLSRFTERVVSLAQKAVVGEPDPAFQEGEDGYADWVIVAIHGLREYLDHTYRRLLDVLYEMHGIVAKLDLAVADLPDFTTVCTRKQDLKMRIWRVLGFLLVVSLLVAASEPREIITNVREHMLELQPLRLEFQQQFEWKLTGKQEQYRGEMLLAGPEQFRITTPDQTVVSDGETMWTYSRLENQVIIDSVRRDSRTLMPRDILFSFPENYSADLWKEEVSINNRRAVALKLRPEGEDQFLNEIRVWVDTGSWEPLRVQLTDINGNNTVYELQSLRQDTTISESAFTFEPPDTTEVIDVR